MGSRARSTERLKAPGSQGDSPRHLPGHLSTSLGDRGDRQPFCSLKTKCSTKHHHPQEMSRSLGSSLVQRQTWGADPGKKLPPTAPPQGSKWQSRLPWDRVLNQRPPLCDSPTSPGASSAPEVRPHLTGRPECRAWTLGAKQHLQRQSESTSVYSGFVDTPETRRKR